MIIVLTEHKSGNCYHRKTCADHWGEFRCWMLAIDLKDEKLSQRLRCLTLHLPRVRPKESVKAEFLLTISIKYQVGEWWDKEKYQITEYWLIQYQILWTNIIRIVWKTVMRITMTSWGWKSYISRQQRLVSRDAQALLKCNPFFLLKSNRGGERTRIPFK